MPLKRALVPGKTKLIGRRCARAVARGIATSLSREDQDAVRGQHQRGAMTQTMQRLRLGINATAVAHDVGVDPILVDVAVKDFTPLTAAGKTDPIVEPIERRKMRDDEHPVA